MRIKWGSYIKRHLVPHELVHLLGGEHHEIPIVNGYPERGEPRGENCLMSAIKTDYDYLCQRCSEGIRFYWREIERLSGETFLRR